MQKYQLKALRAMKPNGVIPINITDRTVVYDIKPCTSKSAGYVVKPLYAINTGTLPGSDDLFTVIDKEFSMQHGPIEVCVKDLKNLKDYPKHEIIENQSAGRNTVRIEGYDFKEVIEKLAVVKLTWKEVVDYMIDDTYSKDERIKDLVKSHMVNLPIDEHDLGKWQAFNNHAITLTNTGTAKTTTYMRAGITPTTDWSVPGLIGTSVNDQPKAGILNGAGAVAIDEFAEAYSEKKDELINFLLNYLENGVAVRTLNVSIVCKGSKAISLLGNCSEGKPGAYDFQRSLHKISTGQMARFGRRFGIIYYGNTFKRTDTGVITFSDALVNIRMMVQSAQSQSAKKVKSIIEACVPWLSCMDKEYEKEVKMMASYCTSDTVSEFLIGHSGSSHKIKMAGLKKAILENLDKIIITKSKKELINTVILPEAEANYAKFKSYNIESFKLMADQRKLLFEKLVRSGVPRDVVIAEISKIKEDGRTESCSQATYYRWLNEMKLTEVSKETSSEPSPDNVIV